MTKIMLVEDDKSLREIYGVRLLAEGYDIVSAGDGEEALAMAIKERPQLIVSDVMMPKVSGYDMLDILRSTTETKNIRVIMMTALSSEEQRTRAESLGADRYLVKSQVGIEDVVRVVHEVLEDTPETMKAAAVPTPTAPPAPSVAPTMVPPVAAPLPVAPAAPAPIIAPQPTPVPTVQPMPVAPTIPVVPTPAPVPTPMPAPIPTALPQPGSVMTPAPVGPIPVTANPMMPKANEPPKPASLKTRIIQPLNDPSISPVNINDLLDKELAKEAGLTDNERPVIASMSQEKAQIEAELKAFTPPEPTPVEAPMTPVESPVQPAATLLPTPSVTPMALPPQPVTTSMSMPVSLPTNEVASPANSSPAAAKPTPAGPPTPMVPFTPATPNPVPAQPSFVPQQPTPPLEAPSVTTGVGPTPVQLPQVPRV